MGVKEKYVIRLQEQAKHYRTPTIISKENHFNFEDLFPPN